MFRLAALSFFLCILFTDHVSAEEVEKKTDPPNSLIGWRLPSTILLSGPFSGIKALRRIAPDLKVTVLSAWGEDVSNEADDNPSDSMRSIVSILHKLDIGRIQLRGKDIIVTGTALEANINNLKNNLKEEFAEYDVHSEIATVATPALLWGAYRSGDSIELFGSVKGDEERARLVDEAMRTFEGANVLDKMKTAGPLSGQSFKAAETLLAQLKSVNTGLVGIFNHKFDVVAEYLNSGDKGLKFQHDNIALCQSFIKLVPKGFKCGLIDIRRLVILAYGGGLPYKPIFVPVRADRQKGDFAVDFVDPRSVDIFFATTRHPEKDS